MTVKKKGKGSRAAKEAKRRVVAAGVIAGKPTGEIARDAKCDARHVERLANEPATRFLIADAMAPHRERLTRLAGKAVAAVAGALGAKTTDKADHMARLRAVGRFGDLCKLAQGVEEADAASARQFTWEEFLIVWRRRQGETE